MGTLPKDDPSVVEGADVMVGDVVIATSGKLAVTAGDYTGMFVPIKYGTVKYMLNDSYYSDLTTQNGPTTQVFYAPVFFDGNMEPGYTVKFFYGGSKREREGASWDKVEIFGGECKKEVQVSEKKTLEKGKIYHFTMTI